MLHFRFYLWMLIRTLKSAQFLILLPTYDALPAHRGPAPDYCICPPSHHWEIGWIWMSTNISIKHCCCECHMLLSCHVMIVSMSYYVVVNVMPCCWQCHAIWCCHCRVMLLSMSCHVVASVIFLNCAFNYDVIQTALPCTVMSLDGRIQNSLPLLIKQTRYYRDVPDLLIR